MWNPCSDILEEWGIGEIEESVNIVESLAPNIEAVESVRASSATYIKELAVLDSEAIHFSLLSLAQLATRVVEHNGF